MVSRIDLVRHGDHPLLGRVLCGRMPGVALSQLGERQMIRCAGWLAQRGVGAVQSSPQARALQSADIIASVCGLNVECVPAFDEIDMGEWTGARFSDLAGDETWQAWNAQREAHRPPAGESAAALQARVVRHLETIKDRAPVERVAIVSHAEPIRVALMHYLTIPLGDFQSVEIDPASISTLRVEGERLAVEQLNGKAMT